MRITFLILAFLVLILAIPSFASAQDYSYLGGVDFGEPLGISLKKPIGAQQQLEGYINVSLDGIDPGSRILISLIKQDTSFPYPISRVVEKEFSLVDILDEQNIDYALDSDGNLISDDFFLINLVPLDIKMPDLVYPDDYNLNTLWLLSVTFGNSDYQTLNAISTPFEVKPLPIAVVYPLYNALNKPVEFNASLSYSPKPNTALTTFEWDFGDGHSKTTTKPVVNHTYTKADNYTLKLKITDEDGLIGIGIFEVEISSSFTIKDRIQRKIDLLNHFINSLTNNTFETEMAMQTINTDALFQRLNNLMSEYDVAVTLPASEREQALADLELELLQVEVPIKIYDSSVLESEFFPDASIIQPNYVKLVSGKGIIKPNTANAIALWQQENVNIHLNAQVKSVLYQTEKQELFSIVNLRIASSSEGPYYLILFLPGDVLGYKGQYNVQEIPPGVLGFTINNPGTQEITLATNTLDLTQIKGFASPDLNTLNVMETVTCGNGICEPTETRQSCPEDCGKAPSGLVIFLIILFVLAGAVAIFFVWYKKPKGYPHRLFKNKRDFDNILNFIRKNLPRKNQLEIKSMLLKVGWKPEQINYAMGKVLRERIKEGARLRELKPSKRRPIFRFKRPIKRTLPIKKI